MSSAYRSAYEHIVGLKRTETREAREALAPLIPDLRDILQARLARIVGGFTGIVAAGAMVWTAIATNDETSTYVLIAGILALAATWLVARGGLMLVGRTRRVASEPTLTGELDADLSLLEKSDTRHELRAIEKRADRLETASVALPIIGITFLLPLFLHWVVACVFGSENAHEFGVWIRISMVVVGHAHIALAVLGYLFAKRLHRSDVESIQKLPIHREWAKMWGITIGVSALPGIILICVPPLLVALTGIAFIPFMVMALRSSVLNERMALARAYEAADLPFQEGKWLYVPPDETKGPPEIEAPPTRVAMGATTFAISAKEQEREAYRDDEHGGADARDRAQA